MFDVGLSELVLIALLALIVLGPKRLPEAARMAGQWLGKLRRFVTDVKQDFDKELHNAELAELQKLKQEIDETRRMMQETSGRLLGQVSSFPHPDDLQTGSTPAPVPNAIAPATTPAVLPTKSKNVKRVHAAKSVHGQTRKTKRPKRR